jgi:predicted nucleic acid-binding Zn ribbon protein
MGNLGGELEKKLVKLGIKKQVEASMIVEEAQKKIEEILGERGKENLRVVSFRNGTLKIAASSNNWAAECQGHIKEFLTNEIKKVVFDMRI